MIELNKELVVVEKWVDYLEGLSFDLEELEFFMKVLEKVKC